MRNRKRNASKKNIDKNCEAIKIFEIMLFNAQSIDIQIKLIKFKIIFKFINKRCTNFLLRATSRIFS